MKIITYKTILLILIISLFSLFVLPFSVLAVGSKIVINEMLPHPSSGSDWLELYKTGAEEVDMSNWKIEDTTGVIKTFTEGTKLASSSSFMQLFISNRLNNEGDRVRLKNKDGVLLDEKTYNQDPGIDVSLGRCPDGLESWGVLVSASPNGSNSDCVPTPTPSPSFTPTPTPTPRVTNRPAPSTTSPPQNTPKAKVLPSSVKIPTKTDSLQPKAIFEQISQKENKPGSILGESHSDLLVAGKEASQSNTSKKLSFSLLILLLGGGLVCIGAAVVLSWKKIKKERELLFKSFSLKIF